MNHSAMILMILACSSDSKTKAFLQTKIVTVLLGSSKCVARNCSKNNIEDVYVSDKDDVEEDKDKGIG